MTSSIGMWTSKILSSICIVWIRDSRFVFTLFSYPAYVCTTYQSPGPRNGSRTFVSISSAASAVRSAETSAGVVGSAAASSTPDRPAEGSSSSTGTSTRSVGPAPMASFVAGRGSSPVASCRIATPVSGGTCDSVTSTPTWNVSLPPVYGSPRSADDPTMGAASSMGSASAPVSASSPDSASMTGSASATCSASTVRDASSSAGDSTSSLASFAFVFMVASRSLRSGSDASGSATGSVDEDIEHVPRKQDVEPEHERRHHDDRDEHDGCVRDELLSRRPDDLFQLLTNLLQELADARALALLLLLRTSSRHRGLSAVDARPLATLRPLHLPVHRLLLAGAEGLDPPTAGFGDRCSTRLSYAPPRPGTSV